VISNNDRKVPFRISSCMRSETLSVIVNAIRYLFDNSVNIARPTIVSSSLKVYFLHYSRIPTDGMDILAGLWRKPD